MLLFTTRYLLVLQPSNLVESGKCESLAKLVLYSADVQITNADESRLGPKSQFKWKTFGFPISSRVNEFVPDTRLGWFGDGTGIHAYHTWLIIEKSNGCEVVTEETQNGPAAVAFNLDQPRAMYDAHDWWLAALKVRSERAGGKD